VTIVLIAAYIFVNDHEEPRGVKLKMIVSWLSALLLWFTVDGSENSRLSCWRRGPHKDSSRAGCGPRARRCAPLT